MYASKASHPFEFRSWVRSWMGVRSKSRLGFTFIFTASLIMLLEVILIFYKLDGHFVYTIDDPYIHLALARQIAQGHYGLQPDIAAAPSSSVLYPFLLAGLLGAGLGQWAPLLINVIATMSSAALFAVLTDEAVPELRRMPVWAVAALATVVVVGLNLVGVALTGMEHGLQIALTLAWLLGASQFLRSGKVAAYWWSCAAALPLVRYEDATLWLATVALLGFRLRRGAALCLLAVGVLELGAFSLLLHSQGLPWLPSSILIKSSGGGYANQPHDVGLFVHFLLMFVSNLLQGEGMLLFSVTLGVAVMAERKRRSTDARDRDVAILGFIAIAVSVAQLTLGRVDGFSRYSIYALTLDIGVLLMGFSADIRSSLQRKAWRGWAVAAILVLGLTPFPTYVHHSLRADLAASNIYEQQFQMRRLAVEFYKAPVAVNDIGLVSLDNPTAVLDLWGLGSEEARIARRDDPSGSWMKTLADRHGVGLAMIYAAWFPHVPNSWVPLAELHLAGPKESAWGDVVTIYATDPDRADAVNAALDQWGPTLPMGIGLTRTGPPARMTETGRAAALTAE